MEVTAWTVHNPGEPMVRETRQETCGENEVLVQVAGCGVCHTDLGFFYDGVPVRHGYPLTLGHEVSGTVVEAGAGAEEQVGRTVIVPAVIPCGTCAACASGRGSICPRQIFPGNDVHGGFASHLKLPNTGLCPVPPLDDPATNREGLELSSLSVIADAVTTPYQAILRSGLGAGDLAIFVGVGGVGGYGVQIARAKGAAVVAIDLDEQKLAAMSERGADLALRSDLLEFKELKKAIRALAKEREIPSWKRFVFETSGSAAGQTTAFGLLEHGAYLSVVGYTPDKVTLRLSNVMAFDARIEGNWGCLPEHYPAVLEMVLSGEIRLAPFIEHRPLDTVNQTFEDLKQHRVTRRVILTPEN